MGKRPKYHFLTIVEGTRGKSLVTLPGQTTGLLPVPDGILVKDAKDSSAAAKAKKTSRPGDILFTTTLKINFGFCTVYDCMRLEDRPVFHDDAKGAYETLISNN